MNLYSSLFWLLYCTTACSRRIPVHYKSGWR